MQYSLSGRNIAVLATDGVEQIQLAWPWEAMLDAGAIVDLVAPARDGIQAFNQRDEGFLFPVDKSLDEADAASYDALVLPGGLRYPETLSENADALRFLHDFHQLSRPVAAMCEAPSMLAKADIVRDRRVTSRPRLRPVIRRAGGIWMDKEVVVDQELITCRSVEALDAFCDAVINSLRDRRGAERPKRSGAPAYRLRVS